MNIKVLKRQVRESFAAVDSTEFLELQIEREADKHRKRFRDHVHKHPTATFEKWKQEMEESVNKNTDRDVLAIGIYLLALDELTYENV